MNEIIKYMKENNLSLRDVAKITRLSHQTIWLHATGRRKPGVKAIKAYHKSLGIPIEKLLKYTNE